MLNKPSNALLQANDLEDVLSVVEGVANLLRVSWSQAICAQLLQVHIFIRAAVITHSLSLIKLNLTSGSEGCGRKNKIKFLDA